MRKFEKVSRIEEDIKLPQRSTTNSAGYDFFAIEDVEIKPIEYIVHTKTDMFGNVGAVVLHENIKPTMVKTGVKVKMPEDEFLMLVNRSSNPVKLGLVVPNGVGIIDADYYNNTDNEGEIMFAFYNLTNDTVIIKKGEKLGQGIFMKYHTVEDDNTTGTREGGFGSTGK